MLLAIDELRSGRGEITYPNRHHPSPSPAAMTALRNGVVVYSEIIVKPGYEKFKEVVDRDYHCRDTCRATFATDVYRELRSFLESELQRETEKT